MHSLIFKTLLAGLVASLLAGGCGKPADEAAPEIATDAQRRQLEGEYVRVKSEMALAESVLPYLVLNVPAGQLEIRLKGTVIWNEPLQIAPSDSEAFLAFAARAQGRTKYPVHYVQDKRLFAAQERFSDSVMTVVSTVLRVDQQLLQRELPAAFQLDWDRDLVLRFYTEVDTVRQGGATEFLRGSWQTIRDFMKGDIPKIQMPAERALTLYRVAHPGMPTMILADMTATN